MFPAASPSVMEFKVTWQRVTIENVIARQAHILRKFVVINLFLGCSSAHLQIFSFIVLIDVEVNINDKF
jgi:hypothetical protein